MSPWLQPDAQVRFIALRTVPGFFAFGFGSGLSRWAPGTAGTLVAVYTVLLLIPLSRW